MAELVDALGSGPSGGNTVEVRVLFWAPWLLSSTGREAGANIFIYSVIVQLISPAPSRHTARMADGSTGSWVDVVRNNRA